MLSAPASVVPLVAGAATGLQFNPIVATATAVIAAALAGYPRAPIGRVAIAAVVVLAGWAIGDGVSLAATAGPASAPAFTAAWGLVGLSCGYALPAVIGASVGRRVVRGTGWLSAAAVALMVSPALSAIGGALGGLLWKAVG